nr:probable 28S ribosomal protein S26, mitochondrial [Nomia melanderi]
MIRGTTVMGTSVLAIRNLGGYDHLISQLPSIQCVRWKRKPIWLGTAKTKIFRVPVKPVIPIEEAEELKRLYNNYRTSMKSLRSFLVQTLLESKKATTVHNLEAIAREDFLIRSSINKTWNEQVAAERELRLQKEKAMRIETILKKKEMKAERDMAIQQRVDAEVRKAKEESATFITPDNIDEAIELAVRNVISCNVTIDLDGNFYPEKPEQVTGTSQNI